MLFVLFDDEAASGILLPAAMMIAEGTTQHAFTEVDLLAILPVVEVNKPVVGGADANDRFPGIQVVVDVFQLLRR